MTQVRGPLVSVIIPTHNRALLLKRAIASVLAQTYEHFEVVVVDDASNDDTGNMVREFRDARIRYIRHDVQCGGAAARNTGIDNALGQFVAFLDSDDVWLPRKLELQLNQMQAPPVDFNRSLFHAQIVSDDGTKRLVLPPRGVRVGEPVADYLFGGRGDIQTSTMMISTSLAREVRFNPRLPRHQDWDFCIRLERHDVLFHFLSEPVSIYYRDDRPDRIGASWDPAPSLSWIESPELGISARAKRAFMAESVAPRLARQGRRFQASWLILKATGMRSIPIDQAAKLLANMYLSFRVKSRLKAWYGAVSRHRYHS